MRVSEIVIDKYPTKRARFDNLNEADDYYNIKEELSEYHSDNSEDLIDNQGSVDVEVLRTQDFDQRVHSTGCNECVNNSLSNVSNRQSSDSLKNRIVNAFENSLATIRQSSVSIDNSKFINRMISAKSLQSFSGDPLDLPRFKQSFELSTALGEYTDSENVKGDARNAIRALLIADNSCKEIMNTLEMGFGNSQIILEKILHEIRDLPSLESRSISLEEFATRLKDAVIAIKSLDDSIGYLYNPELVSHLLKKMTSAMSRDFIKYAAKLGKTKPVLERLADFIYIEDKTNIAAGIISYENNETSNQSSNKNTSNNSRNKVKVICTTSTDQTDNENQISYTKNLGGRCAHCDRKNHRIQNCKDLAKLSLNQRWKIIKSKRLCYKCLGEGYARSEYKKEVCKKCGRRHQELLHSPFNKDKQLAESQSNLKVESTVMKINDETVPFDSDKQDWLEADVYLKIIPILLLGTRDRKLIYALLDEGSTATVINKNIIDKIRATVRHTNVSLKGIGSDAAILFSHEKTNLKFKGFDSNYSVHNVLVVNNLALPE